MTFFARGTDYCELAICWRLNGGTHNACEWRSFFEVGNAKCAQCTQQKRPVPKAIRSRTPHLLRPATAGAPVCEHDSPIHFSSGDRSRAVCQRSSGFFARSEE